MNELDPDEACETPQTAEQSKSENEDRVTALEKRLEDLEKRHYHQIAEQQKALAKVETFVSLLDQHEANRLLGRMQGRLSELSDRLEVEILKDCVLSEVTRLYPAMWKKLVRALDKPDEWWMKGDKYSIERWVDRLNEKEQ